MERKDLKKGIKVCHRKYGRCYRVVSVKCKYKDSDPEKDWIVAVTYRPLYKNDDEMFMREQNSFLEGFDLVRESAFRAFFGRIWQSITLTFSKR